MGFRFVAPQKLNRDTSSPPSFFKRKLVGFAPDAGSYFNRRDQCEHSSPL
jgi:hypothetical protein